MLYRKVPKTGDELSVLGFGCMRLPTKRGGGIDEGRAIRQVRYTVDHGVNFVVTAPAYHLGRSESVLSRAQMDTVKRCVSRQNFRHGLSVLGKTWNHILDAQLAKLQTGFYRLLSAS